MTTNETPEAIDSAQPEVSVVADNDSLETSEIDVQEISDESHEVEGAENEDDNIEFPKKAVNALNRKNKTITKLRAQMRELEAKLNESPEVKNEAPVNPDDFESYGDYINAQVEALVDQKSKQSQSEMQRQQLTQQQQMLEAQRNQHIIEQAQEASQVFSDLPKVWQDNAQLLDALPKEVADIFYDIDNAPAAVYTLAKEGKLESLLYANPAVAAYEIVSAQNRGLEALSKPRNRMSQAPQPISKARGTGSVKKQLTPNDDVLKSLGLKT